MTLKQTIEAFEALDSARASGRTVVDLLAPYPAASVSVEEVRGNKGKTDFVKIIVAGMQGRLCGGAPARSASSAASAASVRALAASALSPTATGRSLRLPPRSRSRACTRRAIRSPAT